MPRQRPIDLINGRGRLAALKRKTPRHLVRDSGLNRYSCGVVLPGRATASRWIVALRVLDRRAWDRTVRAIDATIPVFRTQQCATALAVIEILAGVDRHRFRLLMPATRTGDRALQVHRASMVDALAGTVIMENCHGGLSRRKRAPRLRAGGAGLNS